MVLDFANEADEIQEAFEPYYERTLLSGGDRPEPALRAPDAAGRVPALHAETTWTASPRSTSTRKATQDRLYAVLAPVVERFTAAPEEEQERLPRPAHRLRAALRLPLAGAAPSPMPTWRSSTSSARLLRR